MLARIRKAMQEKDQGFTLIELLVVIVIIGILAAIAIPTFLNQREKAWTRAAQSDLRNAATNMETYFGDNGTYVGGPGADNAFKISTETNNNPTVVGASTTGYCIQIVSKKLQGADATWNFKSSVGSPAKGACA
ncbi:type IV pilin protein [Kineococcus sp. TBRC 1896]|uniref:Type IV pilin protein n=1 Tax=Kineococcus mangrovi TaxID=1660183 RepID=A0ABV4I2P1_9ACTN